LIAWVQYFLFVYILCSKNGTMVGTGVLLYSLIVYYCISELFAIP